jgi:excisionase family DNA binding protein
MCGRLRRDERGRIIPQHSYTSGQAAALLEVPRGAVRRWTDAGLLPAYRLPRATKGPRPPAPPQLNGTAAGVAYARQCYRERRITHGSLIHFCQAHAPDFQHCIDKFSYKHVDSVERWIRSRTKRPAPEPGSESPIS